VSASFALVGAAIAGNGRSSANSGRSASSLSCPIADSRDSLRANCVGDSYYHDAAPEFTPYREAGAALGSGCTLHGHFALRNPYRPALADNALCFTHSYGLRSGQVAAGV